MGKSSKRIRTSSTTKMNDTDDDSGFCGSNLMAPKMVRLDDEMMLLKALMKEVNEPNVGSILANVSHKHLVNNNVTNKYSNNLLSKSKNGKYELKILLQPEEQHRFFFILIIICFTII